MKTISNILNFLLDLNSYTIESTPEKHILGTDNFVWKLFFLCFECLMLRSSKANNVTMDGRIKWCAGEEMKKFSVKAEDWWWFGNWKRRKTFDGKWVESASWRDEEWWELFTEFSLRSSFQIHELFIKFIQQTILWMFFFAWNWKSTLEHINDAKIEIEEG